jgi:hypothetical protein
MNGIHNRRMVWSSSKESGDGSPSSLKLRCSLLSFKLLTILAYEVYARTFCVFVWGSSEKWEWQIWNHDYFIYKYSFMYDIRPLIHLNWRVLPQGIDKNGTANGPSLRTEEQRHFFKDWIGIQPCSRLRLSRHNAANLCSTMTYDNYFLSGNITVTGGNSSITPLRELNEHS